MDLLFNAIGLSGTIAILAAYFLLQHGTLKENSVYYLLINLTGALALIISLLRFWNLASFLLNFAWVAISAYGLLRTRRAA